MDKRRTALPRCRHFLGDGSLDAHAFDEEIILLVLLDGVLRGKPMKVVVPDSVSNQLFSRGKTVLGWVDEEFARVHFTWNVWHLRWER